MIKKILLEVQSQSSNGSGPLPKHFSIILDDNLIQEIKKIRTRLDDEDFIKSPKVVKKGFWGEIDSLYYDLPLKDLFQVVESTKHRVKKPEMVLTEDGFYFQAEEKGYTFRTSLTDYKELDKNESIIFGVSFNPCGKWL